jgi:hypothetical protein
MANEDGGNAGGNAQLMGRIVIYPTAFDDGDVEDWLRHFKTCWDANG